MSDTERRVDTDELSGIPNSPAVFSKCGRYRYFLRRDLDLCNRVPLLGILLNPSKAGPTTNDPTTTVNCRFASNWGFGIWAAVNLFAWVDTDPRNLPDPQQAIGPLNDEAIRRALAWVDATGGRVYTAWGTNGSLGGRADQVLAMLAGRPLLRLGQNQDGTPRFPRAIAKDTQPEEWTA